MRKHSVSVQLPSKSFTKNFNSQGSKSLCMNPQHRASHHEQMVAVFRKGTYRINDDHIGCAVDFASVKKCGRLKPQKRQ
jgi:hypothetical protein